MSTVLAVNESTKGLEDALRIGDKGTGQASASYMHAAPTSPGCASMFRVKLSLHLDAAAKTVDDDDLEYVRRVLLLKLSLARLVRPN